MANPAAERKFMRVETGFPTLAVVDGWSYPARDVATEHECSTVREELGRIPGMSACHDSFGSWLNVIWKDVTKK
jgi:hypothetical protein